MDSDLGSGSEAGDASASFFNLDRCNLFLLTKFFGVRIKL